MKTRILILVILTFALLSCKSKEESKIESNGHEHVEQEATEVKKKVLSPHTSAMAMVNDAHIHIDYSSPGVRGRIIFGGLLPYDEVWQAGAHMATWVETDKDLLVNGEPLKKGKYGFFLIPSRDSDWTVIFNSRWDQHGKDEYNESEDILRTKITPEYSEETTEHLTYEVRDIGDGNGYIIMQWDKIELRIPFNIN